MASDDCLSLFRSKFTAASPIFPVFRSTLLAVQRWPPSENLTQDAKKIDFVSGSETHLSWSASFKDAGL